MQEYIQKELAECISIHKQLEKTGKKLVKLFNDNNGLYDGDPLFQPKDSPICKFWRPRGDDEEELFMNFNCGHPDAEFDWGDGDHCSIMTCLDESKGTQIAGQIANLHSQIHPVEMKVLDLFNDNSKSCIYRYGAKKNLCCHTSKKEDYCCAAKCPL